MFKSLLVCAMLAVSVPMVSSADHHMAKNCVCKDGKCEGNQCNEKSCKHKNGACDHGKPAAPESQPTEANKK